MRQKSRLSFVRTQQGVIRLTVLIGVVIVCLAVLWAWADQRVAVGQTKVEVLNLSRSIAEHTHDVIQEADTILVGLSERVEVDGVSPASIARLNRLMARRAAVLPLIHALVVIGSDGTMLAGSVPVPAGGLNYSDRPYFQAALQSPGLAPLFGPPVRSKLDGSWIITVSRRLNDADGHFAGVAVATITTEFFQRSFASFDIGEKGAILLATEDGTIVARRPFLPVSVGRNIGSSEMFARIRKPGQPTAFTYKALLDGLVRIGGYHRVDGYPLLVVVARARDQALAVWRMQTATLAGEVLCVLLGLAWIARRIVRQLGDLRLAEMGLKRAHARLLRSKARLAEGNHWLLLAEEIGHVGHWRLSLPDHTLSWSDEVYRIHGLPTGDSVDLDAAIDAYHPEDRETLRRAVDEAVSAGVPLELSSRIVRPDGEIRYITSRGTLQHDPSGKPISLFGVCLDQTEQRRIETDLRRAQRETEAANAQLNLLARQDGLTGIANRRHFDEMLDSEYRRGARASTCVALVMIDVDHFKAFNDRYGHPEGDRCLQAIAAVLETMLRRPADLAARYGGEELALLLPGTDLEGAYALATRVVDGVRALELPHLGSPQGVVTISAGVQAVVPDLHQSARETLLIEADRALYIAKCAGRSRAAMLATSEPDYIERAA